MKTMPKYNHSYEEDDDGMLWEHWTDRSGREHTYIPIGGDDYDDDDVPEGCAACGGDYPNCADSCPLFDD